MAFIAMRRLAVIVQPIAEKRDNRLDHTDPR